MRRQTDRRAQRLRKIAHLFPLIGVSSDNVYAVQGDSVHKYRNDATAGKVTLEQLMSILLLMAKNRGYNGRFVTEDGKIKTNIDELTSQMQENGHQTIGQFLYERKKNKLNSSVIQGWKKVFEGDGKVSSGTYISRDMLKYEFEIIFNEQQKHHPSLLELCPETIKESFFSYKTIETTPLETVRDAFYHALFDQRPLWWKTETIGFCPLEPGRPRAAKAHSEFQTFRIEQTVQNLKWGVKEQSLTREEKDCIRETMLTQKTVKAKSLYKKLGIQNRVFNMDREKHTGSECEFDGNKTQAAIKKLEKEANISLTQKEQNLFIELLADVGDASAFSVNGWEHQENFKEYFHDYSEVEQNNIVSFLETLILKDKLSTLAKMNFDSGRASYSVEALKKLTQEMREQNITLDKAVENLYPDKKNKYRSTKIKKIGDGVVQQSIRETRKAVEYVIQKYGVPQKVVVELSREMKLSQEKRRNIEKAQEDKQSERESCRNELKSRKFEGSDTNVKRYLFWEEQDKKCSFCGITISMEDSVDGNKTNLEHTIPKSKGGESTHANLTLAHRSCNVKKGEQLPLEAFTGKERDSVIAMSQVFENKGKKKSYAYWKDVQRKAKLFLTETIDDIDDMGGFKLRQNTETSWIGREMHGWLKSRINSEKEDRVYISKGQLTGYLRRKLGLNTLIPDLRHKEGKPNFSREEIKKGKKNRTQMEDKSWHLNFDDSKERYDKRIDHRHHVLDAAVVGLVDRNLFKFATKYSQRHGNNMKGFFQYLQKERFFPVLDDLRKELHTRLFNYEIWHKPDRYPIDGFFKENRSIREKQNISLDGSAEKKSKDKIIQRQSLEAFVEDTKEKTLKALDIIVGDTIKEHVKKEFEKRYEKTFSEISPKKERIKLALCGKDLEDGIFFPLYKNKNQQQKIKKLRCYQKKGRGLATFRKGVDKTLTVKKSEHTLINEGYACVEVNEEKKIIPIPYWKFWTKAYQSEMETDKHIRLFKNDMIFNEKDQFFYVIKKIALGVGIQCIRSTETGTFDSLDKTVSRAFSSCKSIHLIKDRAQLAEWKRRITPKDES